MNEDKIMNLSEAKDLVKRYRKITLKQIEQIKEKYQWSDYTFAINTLHILTGFGSTSTCHLCKPLNVNTYGFSRCKQCIYGYNGNKPILVEPACETGKGRRSYDAIDRARTAKALLKAIKNRATVLEKLIKTAEKKLKTNKGYEHR